MKNFVIVLTAIALTFSLAACKGETEKAAPTKAETAPTAPAAPQAPQATGQTGTVIETMDAGGYTYVQVDLGTEKIWAAAPQFAVEVGTSVIVPQGMPMQNFESKTLGRTFETVYFVDGIAVAGGSTVSPDAPLPQGHPETTVEASPAAEVDMSGIEKVAGGKTVAEVFANKSALGDKEVSVRGKVVKFNQEIMGKNWIHLQDGTSDGENSDLTITTAAVANIGDTVLVTGKVTLDKDFGYGYKYEVILEDAQVTVE